MQLTIMYSKSGSQQFCAADHAVSNSCTTDHGINNYVKQIKRYGMHEQMLYSMTPDINIVCRYHYLQHIWHYSMQVQIMFCTYADIACSYELCITNIQV